MSPGLLKHLALIPSAAELQRQFQEIYWESVS